MTDLATLLADPSQDIAFVVELTYRDPDTDTVSTKRVTSANWRGREAGYLRFLLADPGGPSVAVDVDELGGLAQDSSAPVAFTNEPPGPGEAGPLDFLRGATLAGRAVTLLAGAPEEAIANYEEIGSGSADGEPEFDDEARAMTMRLKSPLDLLRRDLDVGTYVGEPGALRGLTSTATASSSYNAAHDLTDFTLAGRVWVDDFGTSGVNSLSSQVKASGAVINFHAFVRRTQTAYEVRVTSGGGAVSHNLTSAAASIEVGRWYWWAYGWRSGYQYLMLEGAVVAESAVTATPDTPAVGIVQDPSGATGLGRISDNRILDHYLPPDEARAWMATRASGDEEGLVGLWRGDDTTGSTLTDYSTTAAHATIAGTEGVDFEHVSSDLGEPEMAGQSMPAPIGTLNHFPADLVSSVFEHWRVRDRDFATTPQKTVRDEGEELTSGTDYSWSGAEPVIALVAEAGEPLTAGADLLGGGLGPNLLREVLVTRGPLSSGGLNLGPWHSLIDAAGGTYTRRRPVRELAEEIMRGSLGYLTLERGGALRADILVSPVAPSPRNGSCIEIINGPEVLQTGGIEWAAPTGSLSGRNFTLALWIKTLRLGPGFGSSPVMLMDLAAATAATGGTQWYMDVGGTTPVFKLERLGGGGIAATASATYGSILEPSWFFLAVVHDHSGGETRFYAAPEGGTLALVGSDGDLSYAAAPPNNGVQVGGVSLQAGHVFRGSVFEPSIWNEARSLVNLQDQMDDGLTGGEANLAFYAPLDGTSVASLTDTVGAAAGSVTAEEVAMRPDLEIDLRKDPRQLARRSLQPAKRIDVRYRRNFARLSPEQITAAVPNDKRLDLQQEYRSDLWVGQDVADDYIDARDVIIESPWYSPRGARATLRLARNRFATGREFALLGPGPSPPLRGGLLLEVGSEVRIYGEEDLTNGPVYRVVSNRRIFGDLDCQLGLWR